MKSFLQTFGGTYTFKTKQDYIDRISKIQRSVDFPWRDDQRTALETFLQQSSKYYVINGIFGCGKTTLLMGMLVQAILRGIYQPDEAMFISFNVSIKNELRKKLGDIGIRHKVSVRTFDSIIYDICKAYQYEYLDLPNFDGKRRFCYKICAEIDSERPYIPLSVQPKVLFIDETQDLESQTYCIFRTFFPNTQIVFAGDIFQSIQKEPRESLLWFLVHTEIADVHKTYMKETPRVPVNILATLKTSLTSYYPEFSEEIDKWHSANPITQEIEWHRFYTYSNIFEKMKGFVDTHGAENSMILTFSSAITVRGAIGDVARFRNFLRKSGFDVNTNHKKMEDGKLFLSTANSSKGLERDYVFVVLTFPLERAFINFSDDLVTNLLTVAVTRAKKKVVFYVPAYEDKFSRALALFTACPKPDKEKIREGKVLDEFTFSDYINTNHCVTELIRQNIIQYDTRIFLNEHIKMFDSSKLFEGDVPRAPLFKTEEEKSLVGVLMENLITSTWKKEWPSSTDIDMLKNHPLYTHCFKRIETIANTYLSYTQSNSVNSPKQFKGIYLYSQLHLAVYNKIFIDIPTSELESYWNKLKPNICSIKPTGNIKIQSNLKMPWVTGIADVIESKDENEVTVWEIKASTEYEWRDNALLQATVYALMTAKSWSRIILLNPFRNEKVSFYFNSKNINSLRKRVYEDVVMWNTNCFMSKTFSARARTPPLPIANTLFVHILHEGRMKQFSVVRIMSPTKVYILRNRYVHSDTEEKEKIEKLCRESSVSEEEAVCELQTLLTGAEFRDAVVWSNLPIDGVKTRNMHELIGDTNVFDKLEYKKPEDQRYSIDERDALNQAMGTIAYVSTIFKFV
jgi:hypothetical protein